MNIEIPPLDPADLENSVMHRIAALTKSLVSAILEKEDPIVIAGINGMRQDYETMVSEIRRLRRDARNAIQDRDQAHRQLAQVRELLDAEVARNAHVER